MATADTHSLIEKIQGLKLGRRFNPYIDFIVFPRYRRIAPGQRIDFTFPLTVLVGRNGTGKSSILHALYGAPKGQNVAHFWFGTAVDPFERGGGDVKEENDGEVEGRKKLAEEQKAAFWYGYKDGNVERQAIKQRVRRETAKAFENQENWEPTRPNETYGMKAIPRDETGKRQRHPQIEMKVKYLSLRFLLSAFDRCFHFCSESNLKQFMRTERWRKIGTPKKRKGQEVDPSPRRPSVQDYIRSRAVRLNSAFENDNPYQMGKGIFSDAPVPLQPVALEVVRQITGKKYQSGTILRHRIYDDAWAYSAKFETEGGQYTEANAGSGETSVVQIVRLFEDAEANSLLLIDEPETSLHPGAQKELLRYILDQIAKKQLQVVLSTHAPALVAGLPREAIKVMRQQPDGLVAIEQSLSAEEAFHEIGHPFDPTCNVIVEDRLAKQIFESVAMAKGAGFAAKLRVEYRPGGDSAMKKDIAVFMHSSHQPVFVFDGDKKGADHTDPGTIAVNRQTPDHLDGVIKAQTGQEIKFQQNSGMALEQKAKLRADYLAYYFRRVFYLPFPSPEEGVWDEEVCRKLLDAILPDETKVMSELALINAEPNHKRKFDMLSKAISQGRMHPDPAHAMFVTRFVNSKGDRFDAISKLLDEVVNAAEVNDA